MWSAGQEMGGKQGEVWEEIKVQQQDVAQDEAQRRSAGGRADRGSIVAGAGTVEKAD